MTTNNIETSKVIIPMTRGAYESLTIRHDSFTLEVLFNFYLLGFEVEDDLYPNKRASLDNGIKKKSIKERFSPLRSSKHIIPPIYRRIYKNKFIVKTTFELDISDFISTRFTVKSNRITHVMTEHNLDKYIHISYIRQIESLVIDNYRAIIDNGILI